MRLINGMNRTYLSLLIVLTFFLSCEVKPVEINYGTDHCHFCKMTIVDRQHAAQMVTVKGRAYKYDAIECMMNASQSWEGPAIKYYLTNDYTNPGELIDARNAAYLISESIPSPMGEFLSAFSSRFERDKMLDSAGGEALNWDQLQNEFRGN